MSPLSWIRQPRSVRRTRERRRETHGRLVSGFRTVSVGGRVHRAFIRPRRRAAREGGRSHRLRRDLGGRRSRCRGTARATDPERHGRHPRAARQGVRAGRRRHRAESRARVGPRFSKRSGRGDPRNFGSRERASERTRTCEACSPARRRGANDCGTPRRPRPEPRCVGRSSRACLRFGCSSARRNSGPPGRCGSARPMRCSGRTASASTLDQSPRTSEPYRAPPARNNERQAACSAIKRSAARVRSLPGCVRGQVDAPDGCGSGMTSKLCPARVTR